MINVPCVGWVSPCIGMPCHTGRTGMVSLQCEFSRERWVLHVTGKLLDTCCRCMVSLLCECVGDTPACSSCSAPAITKSSQNFCPCQITNSQQYLHYHSCHPISTKCSIPYSLATQGQCICSHPDNLHTYTSNLTKAITSYGYPVLLIEKQLFHEAQKICDRGVWFVT